MRVLYVINSLNIGGAEKLCVDLMKKAKEKNIIIDIYVLNNMETFLTKELKQSNINIFNCGSNNYKSIKHIIWLIKNKNKYNVIHSHLSYSQYFTAMIRIFDKKLKLITTEHNTFNERRKFKIFKIIEALVYGAYNNVIVINEENLKSIVEWQPSIKERTIVINNGIDIEKYKNGKRDNIKDAELINIECKNKIIMIAAYRKQKNHRFMLEVMEQLNEDTVLILVGDGEENIKNQINQSIGKKCMKNRVIQLGNRDDIENLIKFCDIAIVPSLWEGFGLVAVECMAGGIPVIGSRVDGLSKVIENKNMLFEVNNKRECIDRIEYALLNKQHLGKEAEKISLKYCVERTLKKYIDIYQ